MRAALLALVLSGCWHPFRTCEPDERHTRTVRYCRWGDATDLCTLEEDGRWLCSEIMGGYGR